MRKSLRRQICLLLFAMVLLGGLAGCGEGSNTSDKDNASPSATVSIESSSAPTVGSTSAPTVGTTLVPTSNPTLDNPDAYSQARATSKIGIWYSVWYDLWEENSVWDIAQGGEILYRPLLPDGTYGKYDSGDTELIQFHLKEIADAQIDFIIMDQTNMIDIAPGNLNTSAIKVAKEIAKWNKVEGNRKIRYCSAIGALATKDNMELLESEAQKLYERYVTHRSGMGTEEHHMYIDGKPLLVVFNCYFTEAEWKAYQKTHDTPYMDKFTVRFSTGHVYEGNYGQWGWVMPDGPQIDEDVAVMMPGWYKTNFSLPFVFRKQGASYESSWKELLASDIVPAHVIINSFNEYCEHTAVFTAKTDLFPANYPIERWIDSSGEENPSMYWDMTKEYIEKFKNGDRN